MAREPLANTPLAALFPESQARVSTPEAVHTFITTFRDNAGHRRAVDAALLSSLFRVPAPALPTSANFDARVWWALQGQPLPAFSPEGSLVPEPERGGIELWTEAELASLHALWNLACDRKDQALRSRAVSAARWLMAEIQPDNATNHPWAVHVFATLSSHADPVIAGDARLYAETLLHNTIIAGQGRPDRFSATILLDAARQLL